MKTTISKRIVIASIIGCGLCCLPLLLPIAAGITGISVFSFSIDAIICGAILLSLAVFILLIYFNNRNRKACKLSDSN